MPSGNDSKYERERKMRERERERERERGRKEEEKKRKKEEKSCLVTNLRKCSDTSERIESALLLPSGRCSLATSSFLLTLQERAKIETKLRSPRVDSEDSAS